MLFVKKKNPTKKQVNDYKMRKRDIYQKFSNLSEEELNTKIIKILMKEMMS